MVSVAFMKAQCVEEDPAEGPLPHALRTDKKRLFGKG